MQKILVADTQPLPDDLVEKLSSQGLKFLYAEHSSQAREALERQGEEVRVVLLDWNFPEGGGRPLLEWIREQSGLNHVEVVVESSDLGPEDLRCCFDCGACRFVSKPWDLHQLQAALSAAVSDSKFKQSLLDEIREYEDALSLLKEGLFEVRNLRDAESLAIGLSRLCRGSQDSVALLELLSNAIEHGNLGIDYKEKSRLLQEGIYREEIDRRLSLPEHRDKKVLVEVKIDPRGATVLISDEGPGFDYGKYMGLDHERLYDPHGRGILMANALLDIEYLPPGNKVRVRLPRE